MLATSLLVLVSGQAFAENQTYDDVVFAMDCGELQNAYGPFDYANPSDHAEKLPVVESYHFNNDVESLKAGMTAELPGGDLDYTLRAFPNHYRALYAMGRYALRYPRSKVPPGANYSGECYFQRAIRFRPDDAIVRLVYGIFLNKADRSREAIEQLETALELDGDNAEIHYNLGLIYEQAGQHRLALEHAQRAYSLGYPLPGLREILKRKGIWEEPSPDTDSSSGD